ncbi:MAG: hypothetical protein Q9220_007352 [cf. Caloplaca sp. 1 TL-2023]
MSRLSDYVPVALKQTLKSTISFIAAMLKQSAVPQVLTSQAKYLSDKIGALTKFCAQHQLSQASVPACTAPASAGFALGIVFIFAVAIVVEHLDRIRQDRQRRDLRQEQLARAFRRVE